MAKTYSYDPTQIVDGGLNQMRFELGDTMTEGGEETCPLCDEEYLAIIGRYGESWKKAKLHCLKAIVMKLAYEVNYSAGGMSLSLSDRFERWQKMYRDLKSEASTAVPTANPAALGESAPDGGHYFRLGLHCNPGAGHWRR